jgi:DNA/RNA endonuclease YhcR with UshA esterase domain
VGVHRSKKNHIFLNFEKPYPNQCFTAVIFASTLYSNFGSFNERSYLGKTVQVSGFIKEYKGKPEIILNYPDQIKVLK